MLESINESLKQQQQQNKVKPAGSWPWLSPAVVIWEGGECTTLLTHMMVDFQFVVSKRKTGRRITSAGLFLDALIFQASFCVNRVNGIRSTVVHFVTGEKIYVLYSGWSRLVWCIRGLVKLGRRFGVRRHRREQPLPLSDSGRANIYTHARLVLFSWPPFALDFEGLKQTQRSRSEELYDPSDRFLSTICWRQSAKSHWGKKDANIWFISWSSRYYHGVTPTVSLTANKLSNISVEVNTKKQCLCPSELHKFLLCLGELYTTSRNLTNHRFMTLHDITGDGGRRQYVVTSVCMYDGQSEALKHLKHLHCFFFITQNFSQNSFYAFLLENRYFLAVLYRWDIWFSWAMPCSSTFEQTRIEKHSSKHAWSLRHWQHFYCCWVKS